MRIRTGNSKDVEGWLALRQELWPDVPEQLHRREIGTMLDQSTRFVVFLAESPEGELCGFLEASVHKEIGEGCGVCEIGYVEAWYVRPAWRRQGIAKQLLEEVEDWTMARGLSVLGSDTRVDNLQSQEVHTTLGFVETDRAVHYRKLLK